jgi:uncharacterized protein
MPPAPPTTLDLDRLALSHGEGRRLELPIHLGAIDLGGQTYRPVPEAGEVSLAVSRTASGHAFHLIFSVRLEGPCMRCLRDASAELSVDAREVDQPSTDDEELTSPYVEEGILDVGRWAHDALVLAMPAQILCRSDCEGLCAVCGEPLEGAKPGEHDHGQSEDPRWAKLRELQITEGESG